MSTEQNKEIVRRAIAALSRGDMDGFLADAADDVTLSVMGSLFPPIQGKQKVLKGLRNSLVARLENGGAIAMTIDNLGHDRQTQPPVGRGRFCGRRGRDIH